MSITKKIKEYKKEILLATGTIVLICIGGTVYYMQEKRIAELKCENVQKLKRIVDLERLCEEKDTYVSKLGSELLRKGLSEGGQLMADKKAYLKSAIMAS